MRQMREGLRRWRLNNKNNRSWQGLSAFLVVPKHGFIATRLKRDQHGKAPETRHGRQLCQLAILLASLALSLCLFTEWRVRVQAGTCYAIMMLRLQFGCAIWFNIKQVLPKHINHEPKIRVNGPSPGWESLLRYISTLTVWYVCIKKKTLVQCRKIFS